MKDPILFFSIMFFIAGMTGVFLANIDVILLQENQTVKDFFPQNDIMEFANATVILSGNGMVSPQT
jgi:hypothetical protein